jgi:hypothetical protein
MRITADENQNAFRFYPPLSAVICGKKRLSDLASGTIKPGQYIQNLNEPWITAENK